MFNLDNIKETFAQINADNERRHQEVLAAQLRIAEALEGLAELAAQSVRAQQFGSGS